MYRIICIFILCVSMLRAEYLWSSCREDGDSAIGTNITVDVEGCEPNHEPIDNQLKKETCVSKQGTVVTFLITFNVNQNVADVYISDIDVNACENPKIYGLTCPLTENGGPYTLRIPFEIPEISAEILLPWQVQNEKRRDIFCVSIPVNIE